MAVIKCKMCGGDLQIAEGMTTAECEYCGSLQTVPAADNEKKLNLFFRANKLRAACEFDRAAGVYESIVAEYPGEAEAYWGLILCKYGIEYVDDPATGKKIPTCHRSSFDSVMDDSNFDMVMECGDVVARKVYREGAKAIEELRKSIIEISGKEEPYDIFISYKDTDDAGQRTVDSVIAQDVYEALTAKGYRVFFSRISLEDKLGTEYEPYIFAALNSAKIMLVFGTDYEYFNAVWVKNEWSRYLQLMTKDKSKHLIPCFKGIDAYDMPKEFQKLSAQDMGKVGAMQDLLRGVGKILPKEEKKPEVAAPVVQQVVQGGGPNVAALVKRGNMALEVKDFEKAEEFFDRALDMDAECGEAYLGKFLLVLKFSRLEDMAQRWVYGNTDNRMAAECASVRDTAKEYDVFYNNAVPGYLSAEQIKEKFHFDFSYSSELHHWELILDTVHNIFGTIDFKRVEQYATGELKQKVDGAKQNVLDLLNEKIANAKKQDAESVEAVRSRYNAYLETFAKQVATMRGNAETQREQEYQSAVKAVENAATIDAYKKAKETLKNKRLAGYRESQTLIQRCEDEIARIQEEQNRQAAVKKEALSKRIKVVSLIVALIACALCAVYIVVNVVMPATKYSSAIKNMENGQYEEAITAFTELGEYKDSAERIVDSQRRITYADAEALLADGKTAEAGWKFYAARGYSDAEVRSLELLQAITPKSTIAIGDEHLVAVKENGQVIATGRNDNGQCDVSNWTDIISVAAGSNFTVGLKKDGTVVATGFNGFHQCDVEDWEGIVSIAASEGITIGITAEGSVVSTVEYYNKLKLENVISVAPNQDAAQVSGYNLTFSSHLIVLYVDGTTEVFYGTVTSATNTAYERGNHIISDWHNIKQISTYIGQTVGLKSDGTIENTLLEPTTYSDNQWKTTDWSDIIYVSAEGACLTAGLKSNGKVVIIADENRYNFKYDDVKKWTDIKAICCNDYTIIGLKSDGTLVAAGNVKTIDSAGRYKISDFKDIRLPD